MEKVLAALLLAAPSVLAHGQVRNFITSSPAKTYAAADAYTVADPTSPIRHINQYGPVPDFTTADITCGPGGNVPTDVLAEVKAGSLVTFDWGSWGSSHSGPVMTYIAKCEGGCASFKGDSGAVWVKIDQDGFEPGRSIKWGENILHQNPSYYSVTIPDELANGEYLLRHEILGLHVASQPMGAQFYPNCVQINVTGGGSTSLPSGIELPGAYDPEDTDGVLVELWRVEQGLVDYVIPGGDVVLPGGTGDWGCEEYAGCA